MVPERWICFASIKVPLQLKLVSFNGAFALEILSPGSFFPGQAGQVQSSAWRPKVLEGVPSVPFTFESYTYGNCKV